MDYVKTQFGNIHMNNIPVVTQQTVNSKTGSAFIFFSIFIIIIIIFIYFIDFNTNVDKKEQIIVESFTNKVATVVRASSINVYDTDEIFLENIIFVTSDDNIINIDVLTDKFVKIIKKGESIMYTLDFKDELAIKEIIWWRPMIQIST